MPRYLSQILCGVIVIVIWLYSKSPNCKGMAIKLYAVRSFRWLLCRDHPSAVSKEGMTPERLRNSAEGPEKPPQALLQALH